SRLLRSNEGTSRGATTSADSTRPSASATATRSTRAAGVPTAAAHRRAASSADTTCRNCSCRIAASYGGGPARAARAQLRSDRDPRGAAQASALPWLPVREADERASWPSAGGADRTSGGPCGERAREPRVGRLRVEVGRVQVGRDRVLRPAAVEGVGDGERVARVRGVERQSLLERRDGLLLVALPQLEDAGQEPQPGVARRGL